MDDLALQDTRNAAAPTSSRAGRGLSGRIELRQGDDIYADDDSYDSEYDEGSREATPPSETYRERGMESISIQTDISALENGVNVTSANGGASTAVGRTIVDLNGDPMEVDEENDQMMVEAAFPTDGQANEGDLQATEAIGRDPTSEALIATESAFIDFDGGEAQEEDALDTKDLEFHLAISSPGIADSGSLSRQESVVEELVASHESYHDAIPSNIHSGDGARGRDSGGEARFQAHAIVRAQQNRNSSARSSPAPEPILA